MEGCCTATSHFNLSFIYSNGGLLLLLLCGTVVTKWDNLSLSVKLLL